MNLYIRTLGFDNMTSEAEAKFIKTGIRESIKAVSYTHLTLPTNSRV